MGKAFAPFAVGLQRVPHFVFLPLTADAPGFELRAVAAVEVTRQRGQHGDAQLCRDIPEGNGDLTAHFRRLVGRHRGDEFKSVVRAGADGAQGHEAVGGVLGLQPIAGGGDAALAELGGEPDGARCDVGIRRFVTQFQHLRQCFFTGRLQAREGDVADVGGGGLQRRQLAFDGFEVQRRHLRLESLRRDAVNGAAAGFVGVLVAAGALVEPVADVDRAIRADADVGGAEERAALVGEVVRTADEVAALEHAGGVAGAEVETLEVEARAVRHRQVAEDDVAPGFAAQQQAVPFLAQCTVFVKAHACGSAAAIDITGRDAAGIVLPPFGGGHALAGALVRTPLAFAVA